VVINNLIDEKWRSLSPHTQSAVRKMIKTGEASTTSVRVSKQLAENELAIVQCRGNLYIKNKVYRGVFMDGNWCLPCASAFLFEQHI